MIDRLNELMQLWPKNKYPLPKVRRKSDQWELSIELPRKITCSSPLLVGALFAVVREATWSAVDTEEAFEPLMNELHAYFAERDDTKKITEPIISPSIYAVHTDLDSYVFLDPNALLDNYTARELVLLEKQNAAARPHHFPTSYRRHIGKAIRESRK